MLILVSILLLLLIAAAAAAVAVGWSSNLALAALRIDAYIREGLQLQRSVAVTLIIVTGVLLGMAAYNWEVTHSQEALFQQVRKQNVLDRMLNEAPGFPFFQDFADSPRGRDLHALWIWLKRMDLLGGDEPESIGAPESRFACLAKLLVAPTSSAIKGEGERCQGVNPIEGADWGKDVSTIEVLVAIAAHLGANSSGIARTDEGTDGQPQTRDEVRGLL